MRRTKYAALAASLALVGAMFAATPASAGTSGDAQLSVTVLTAVDISFTDAAEDFGSLVPGSTVTQASALAYTVSTNNALGYKVMIGALGAPMMLGSGIFDLSNDAGVTWTNISDSATLGVWRTTGAAGSTNYHDDARVVLPSDATPGSYTATITYTATTN